MWAINPRAWRHEGRQVVDLQRLSTGGTRARGGLKAPARAWVAVVDGAAHSVHRRTAQGEATTVRRQLEIAVTPRRRRGRASGS